MATKFQHNGVEVTLGSDAKFTAVVGGAKVTAPSLDAMKKKIDKAVVFKPFKIVFLNPRGKAIDEDMVIGSRKARSRFAMDANVWVTKRGREFARVTDDTPENRATLTKLIEMRNRHEEIEASHQEEQERLEASLPSRKVPE